MLTIMKLAKRSLCACGFALVHDDVPLGKEYHADLNRIQEAVMVCGGCGKHIPVTGIWCGADEYGAGIMPLEALETLEVAS
jgi:hypothetical protein